MSHPLFGVAAPRRRVAPTFSSITALPVNRYQFIRANWLIVCKKRKAVPLKEPSSKTARDLLLQIIISIHIREPCFIYSPAIPRRRVPHTLLFVCLSLLFHLPIWLLAIALLMLWCIFSTRALIWRRVIVRISGNIASSSSQTNS